MAVLDFNVDLKLVTLPLGLDLFRLADRTLLRGQPAIHFAYQDCYDLHYVVTVEIQFVLKEQIQLFLITRGWRLEGSRMGGSISTSTIGTSTKR